MRPVLAGTGRKNHRLQGQGAQPPMTGNHGCVLSTALWIQFCDSAGLAAQKTDDVVGLLQDRVGNLARFFRTVCQDPIDLCGVIHQTLHFL